MPFILEKSILLLNTKTKNRFIRRESHFLVNLFCEANNTHYVIQTKRLITFCSTKTQLVSSICVYY